MASSRWQPHELQIAGWHLGIPLGDRGTTHRHPLYERRSRQQREWRDSGRCGIPEHDCEPERDPGQRPRGGRHERRYLNGSFIPDDGPGLAFQFGTFGYIDWPYLAGLDGTDPLHHLCLRVASSFDAHGYVGPSPVLLRVQHLRAGHAVKRLLVRYGYSPLLPAT